VLPFLGTGRGNAHLKVLATKQEAWERTVDKYDEVIDILIDIKDACDRALEVLAGRPHFDEPLSEGPAERAVAESDGTQLPKRGKRTKTPTTRRLGNDVPGL